MVCLKSESLYQYGLRLPKAPEVSTVYGLYRDGTELRGVYYKKPEVAGAACSSMGEQCDYPILLGMLSVLRRLWLRF